MPVIDGERLDHYLVRCGFTPSRRHASALIASGRVRVNGRRYRKGEVITSGDQVEVQSQPEASPARVESKVLLEILHKDDELLIVAKPPLLPCYPLESKSEETVVTALARDYPEVAELGEKPLEGGLIHRLDNGTSGALMVARTCESLVFMREALRAGRIARRYEALVEGRLQAPAALTWPIAHHRKNPARMVIAGDSPLSADATRAERIVRAPYRGTPREGFSQIEPIRHIGNFTLVDVVPRTGRRHQIRVHLAAAGHPIANDQLYGGDRLEPLEEGRFWLHLAELRFTSAAGREIHVIAPRPSDLEMSLIRPHHP